METIPSVLVPIAHGFEEIETLAVVDILRRAQANVVISSIMGKNESLQLTGQQGVKIECDQHLEDVINQDFTLITLPGGLKNSQALSNCDMLIQRLKSQKEQNKLFSAICASGPVVLKPHGLLEGISATGYPTFTKEMPDMKQERVVFDRNCITSQGPGTACEFGIKLVEILFDKQKAIQIAQKMLIKI